MKLRNSIEQYNDDGIIKNYHKTLCGICSHHTINPRSTQPSSISEFIKEECSPFTFALGGKAVKTANHTKF